MVATLRLLALGAALVVMTGGGSARHFQPPASAREDVEEVVKLLREKVVDRAAVAKKVAAIRKKNDDLKDLMVAAYGPTTKRAAGWNPAKQSPGDGIEKRIDALGKKELSAEQFAKEKELILRAAYYSLAVYEISKAFAPTKVIAGKGPKQWHAHNDEFAAGTKEMIEATKAKDPKALKKAMGKIGASCNGCHTDFR